MALAAAAAAAAAAPFSEFVVARFRIMNSLRLQLSHLADDIQLLCSYASLELTMLVQGCARCCCCHGDALLLVRPGDQSCLELDLSL